MPGTLPSTRGFLGLPIPQLVAPNNGKFFSHCSSGEPASERKVSAGHAPPGSCRGEPILVPQPLVLAGVPGLSDTPLPRSLHRHTAVSTGLCLQVAPLSGPQPVGLRAHPTPV